MSKIEKLVRAGSKVEAEGIASIFAIPDNEWTYVPFTTSSENSGVFQQISSPVINHEEWAKLPDEEQNNRSLTNLWGTRILLASDFWAASKYAADRNWWLHSWAYLEVPVMDKVLEYQKVG